jgi:phosphoribosylglycinamide formyltransferase-1
LAVLQAGPGQVLLLSKGKIRMPEILSEAAADSESALKILVLVSGNGTNLQALLDAQGRGEFGKSAITLVAADNPEAFALERAKKAGVETVLLKEKKRKALSDEILALAQTHQIGVIVLAGFMRILSGSLITTYEGRMLNLHPALLPKFGGPGMYGAHVHQAVLDAGEKESGCTVHLVNAGVDAGPILVQRRVPVLPGDSADSLAERIHKEEHIAIVDGLKILLRKLGGE